MGRRAFWVRMGMYVFGLFVLTFGTTLSINTRMGLSAGNTFPYVFSLAAGISFGSGLIVVYCSYVVLQFILLGRDCPKRTLLQVPVALVYGRFADFWVWVIGDFAPETYWGRLIMLGASIVVVGIGVAFYITPNIMTNPIEGLAYAVAARLKWPFYKGKTLIDCLSVVVGLVVGVVFLGYVTGIREGTILSAMLTGATANFFFRLAEPVTVRLAGTDSFLRAGAEKPPPRGKEQAA